MENLGYGGRVAGEVALGALRDATTAPGDEDILRKSRVGVLDLDEGELDAALVEILDQVGQLAVCVRGVSTRTIMSAAGTNEQLRTACALDLEDTLLGGAILESADERCLNGEERPLSVRGRARCWRLAVDDAGVAALYGRPIDGKVQRRHGKWRGEVGSVPDVVTASAAVEWGARRRCLSASCELRLLESTLVAACVRELAACSRASPPRSLRSRRRERSPNIAVIKALRQSREDGVCLTRGGPRRGA